YESADEVKREALGRGDVGARLDNRLRTTTLAGASPVMGQGLQRIGEVPIYAADALVRRARSLQATPDAAPPVAWMNRALFERLGLRPGDSVRVRQGAGEAVVPAGLDDRLPPECIRLAAARPETA